MIAHYSGQYREIGEIFDAAVRQTALGLYSQEQVDAWAPPGRDLERWKWRCELKRPFVYLRDGRVAGFAELDTDGHIDCLYTHPQHNRTGVGSALLRHIIEVARRNAIPRLYTEASHLARGLFLKHGFAILRENHLELRGVKMSNWIMELDLT